MIAPQLDVRSLRLGGRHVEGTVDTVAIRLSAFDIDTEAPGTPLTATGAVDIGGPALLLPLKKPIRIGAQSIGNPIGLQATICRRVASWGACRSNAPSA